MRSHQRAGHELRRGRGTASQRLPTFRGSKARGDYAASGMESQLCAGDEVAIVGAANSAGRCRFSRRNGQAVHSWSARMVETRLRYLIRKSMSIPRSRFGRDGLVALDGGPTDPTASDGDSKRRRREPDINMCYDTGAVPHTGWSGASPSTGAVPDGPDLSPEVS